jgi:hypothetical protein
MQPDIHLWDRIRGGSIWDENIHAYMYPTLCGIYVRWAQRTPTDALSQLAFDFGLPRKDHLLTPTCMGCILVKFQQEAEEQDGS